MFENKIDFWMVERGLKNKHLAKLCNVSETTFSKWRQNKTQPDFKSVVIIARELSIPTDELYEWNDDEK